MSIVGFSSASLTLSDDRAIESVLTDIPFFCVGLMTFGIFTFVLVLKRINIIVLYLYLSSFLAFAAAIFDLGHILTEPRPVVVNGVIRDAPSGLVTTREIGLALSVGFLYIFLWHLVAQCPHDESNQERDSKFNGSRSTTHSASWKQWGSLGIALQWSLLGLSIVLSALQIVWRISPLSAQITTIYITETVIEIVVSSLFILKIVLNIFLSRTTPRWKSTQSNIASLVSLGISVGLGLGNLLAPSFSETILGRFLRAVEMYILILFVLITTFYTHPVDSLPSLPRDSDIEQGKLFKQLPSEKPVDPIDPSLHFTAPRPPRVISWGTNPSRSYSPSTGKARPSTVTWVVPGTAERDARSSVSEDRSVLGTFVAVTPASSNAPTPRPSTTLLKSPIKVETNASPFEDGSGKESAPPLDKHLTSVSAVSISSYYGMDHRTSSEALPVPLLSTLPRETDSPVYGLNGIVAQRRRQPTHRPKSSSISFNELLRQQTELDKSIAALRLYAADDSVLDATLLTSSNRGSELFVPKAPTLRTGSSSTNSYLGRKPESASNRSEFSLSNFPQPPEADLDGIPNSVKLERLVGRARALRLEPRVPQSVEVKVDDNPSLPVSPNQFEGTSRMESAGSQYDVTSFIGGLTLPGRGSGLTTGSMVGPVSGLATVGSSLSDVNSEDEASPSEVAPSIRPMILTTATIVVPNSVNNERPRAVLVQPRRAPTPLRPLLLGTATAEDANVVASLGSSSKVPIGPKRRLRREISVPTLPGGDGEDAPDAFERPRAPPLLSK